MRRYGTTGYGGYGNDYPLKTQPGAFGRRAPARGDLLRLTPSDIAPRQPSRPYIVPPPEPIAKGGAFDVEEIIERLIYKLQETPHAYNNYDVLRYGSFKTLPLFVSTMDSVVLEKATDIRTYLFIVNTHPVNDLFITFQVTATPLIGVPISPARGFYEFIAPVPQDAIHLVASAAGTTGVLVYAERDPRALTLQPGPV